MRGRRRGGRYAEGGRLPYEIEPRDHEHWFQWHLPPVRRSWTENAYIAFALGVALTMLLIVLFGLAPLMALLG